MKGLKGKVVIVTGGAGGIGMGICERFIEEGSKVIVCDVRGEDAEVFAEKLRKSGGDAVASHTDVENEDAVKKMIDATVEKYGTVDILVNNAMEARAEYATKDLDCLNMDFDVFNTIMRVNMGGYLLTSKHCLPIMLKKKKGIIINVSSINCVAGDTARYAYTASKAAINTLTRNIATSYGPQGIRCNSVLPGFIIHDRMVAMLPQAMVDLNLKNLLSSRQGYPEDIAGAVAFFSSDDADFINGQLLTVDGGTTAHSTMYGMLLMAGTEAGYVGGDS